MLCREAFKLPVVYDITTGNDYTVGLKKKMNFIDEYKEADINKGGKNTLCFAGPNDELVISPSKKFDILFWFLPPDQPEDGEASVLCKTLASVQGHKCPIYSVRYNSKTETFASAGAEKIIKLWTPIVQQQ